MVVIRKLEERGDKIVLPKIRFAFFFAAGGMDSNQLLAACLF